MRSHYLQVLQLSDSATKEEIKSAYRELSKQYHPDVNSDADAHEKFLEIKTAYEYLTDGKADPQLNDYFHTHEQQQPSSDEIWRAEQKRKYREKQKEKERQQALLIVRLVNYSKPLALLSILWNVLLSVDYTLPFERHDQEILAVSKGYEHRRSGSYHRYDRVFFEDYKMKFDKNELPDVRDYEKAEVEATVIFQKPMAAYITLNGETNRYQQIYNIYIIFGYLIPVMLILGGAFFYLKKPSHRLNAATLLFFFSIFQVIFFLSQ